MFELDAIREKLEELFPDFKYREFQYESILMVLEHFLVHQRKYVILDAPVGAGKSIIGVHVACVVNAMLESRGLAVSKLEAGEEAEKYMMESLFLTKTIALQHQYTRDFPEMKSLKSAVNFGCHQPDEKLLPNIHPKQKAHASCRFVRDNCEYQLARQIYEDSPLKLLNYAFYFHGIFKYNTKGLLVIDEAHNIPEYIIDHSACPVDFIKLDKMTNFPIKSFLDIDDIEKNSLRFFHMPHLQEFIRTVSTDLVRRLEKINAKIEEMEMSPALVALLKDTVEPLESDIKYCDSIKFTLFRMMKTDPNDWLLIADEEEKLKFELKPLIVPEPSIHQSIGKSEFTLLMTGTVGTMAEDLNLDEYYTVKMPSTFPVDNRSVMAVNTLPKLNYSSRDLALPKYVEYIDSVLEDMQTESGVIHTSSYANAEFLLENSRFKKRLFVPDKEQLRDIKTVVKPGRILVSPAMMEGIDLPDDMCRLSIIMKLPYKFLGDQYTKAKCDEYPTWYKVSTIVDVIQATGRGVRNKDDFCLTLILDPGFEYLVRQTKDYIPKWFLESLI